MIHEFYWETKHAERWSSENGPFATRQEAVEAAKTAGYEDGFQTGIREDCCAAQFVSVSVDRILEDMQEAASDEVGEAAEDWPDLSEEEETNLENSLVAVVRAFFEQRDLEPHFWKITEIQDHPSIAASTEETKP